jgi:hypothetical protein
MKMGMVERMSNEDYKWLSDAQDKPDWGLGLLQNDELGMASVIAEEMRTADGMRSANGMTTQERLSAYLVLAVLQLSSRVANLTDEIEKNNER